MPERIHWIGCPAFGMAQIFEPSLPAGECCCDRIDAGVRRIRKLEAAKRPGDPLCYYVLDADPQEFPPE